MNTAKLPERAQFINTAIYEEMELLADGCSPDQARDALTEFVTSQYFNELVSDSVDSALIFSTDIHATADALGVDWWRSDKTGAELFSELIEGLMSHYYTEAKRWIPTLANPRPLI